jgi:prepilin-type processing-associated H-X9-DG protein
VLVLAVAPTVRGVGQLRWLLNTPAHARTASRLAVTFLLLDGVQILGLVVALLLLALTVLGRNDPGLASFPDLRAGLLTSLSVSLLAYLANWLLFVFYLPELARQVNLAGWKRRLRNALIGSAMTLGLGGTLFVFALAAAEDLRREIRGVFHFDILASLTLVLVAGLAACLGDLTKFVSAGIALPVDSGAAEGVSTLDVSLAAAVPPAAPVGLVTADYVPAPSAEMAGASAADSGRSRNATGPEEVAGYDILEVLGHGGMGVVYKARQRGVNRTVALKMIRAGADAGEDELARFRIEAEAVARLQHVNIVEVYEFGDADGQPFFSLEFVGGGSLAERLAGTPQPPHEAARTLQLLAAAVQCAHERGIIHRDLKPANVLLTADGEPKIADFGLAKIAEGESVHTQSGTLLGTPSYMAPEQAEGRMSRVGPLSDVYALGAILYEMLTGRPPFKAASTWKTLEQVCTRKPVPPSHVQPGVPRDLEKICLQCLEKQPARRYHTAAALAEDLRRFLAGEPVQARPFFAPVRFWRPTRKLTELLVVVAILVVLVGMLVPAILKSRAAEARIRCANNLAQIAVGAQNYEATHGSFPPGLNVSPNSKPPNPQWNWPMPWAGPYTGCLAYLLPYVGQDNVYKQLVNFDPGLFEPNTRSPAWAYGSPPWDFQDTNVPSWAWNGTGKGYPKAANTRIENYLCPSDPGESAPVSSTDTRTFTILAGIGFNTRRPVAFYFAHSQVANIPGYGRELGRSNYLGVAGAFGEVQSDDTVHGPLAPFKGIYYANSRTKVADITDGTSNTLAFGEYLGWRHANGQRTAVLAWMGAGSLPTKYGLTPNHGPQGNDYDLHQFQSTHSRRIVNFAFADGSVRGISRTVDLNVFLAASGMADGTPLSDF